MDFVFGHYLDTRFSESVSNLFINKKFPINVLFIIKFEFNRVENVRRGIKMKRELIDAIAETLYSEKCHELKAICTSYGLFPQDVNLDPCYSKRSYIKNCLLHKNEEDIIEISRKILSDYNADFINPVLAKMTSTIFGDVQNIIFAADNGKPDLIFNALTNGKVIKHSNNALVYDDIIDETKGLSWGNLVNWWLRKFPQSNESDLYNHLLNSLQSNQEKIFFKTYYDNFKPKFGEELPALLPQVYVFYDPKTNLNRVPQRIDFFMLLSNFNRMVFEIDGSQHFSKLDNSTNIYVGSKKEYAKTLEDTRILQLNGFQVFRFGTYDIYDMKGKKVTRDFFETLFKVKGLL
jgi:hypothetical protein